MTPTKTPEERDAEARRVEWSLFAGLLRIVEHAASRDTSRYNLNTVFLERDGNHITATATDGHRLMQARTAVPVSGEAIALPAPGFLLSLDDVTRLQGEAKRLAKMRGKHWPAMLRVKLAENGSLLFHTLAVGDETWESVESSISCKPIASEFPNYRVVIPEKSSLGKPVMFNAAYLAEAYRALGSLNKQAHSVVVRLGGNAFSPTLLEAKGADGVLEAFAIIMPMKP